MKPIRSLQCTVRERQSQLLRHGVQLIVALIFVVAAYKFAGFVEALRSGGPAVNRPPVVEGFLPVAAIIALRALVATGQFDPIHPAGLVILLSTLATAWLFRRALCSWLCPIGTLSEVLWRTGSRIPWRLNRLPRWLDWLLLGLKYAAFVYVVKVFFLMPAREALGFMGIPYYTISDVRMFDFFAGIGATGALVLGALFLLILFIKNFWCRYLCPWGAVLGGLGLFSPFQIKRESKACNDCGICTKACPNGVDVAKKKRWVVSPECTGCVACVSRCPREGALSLRLAGWVKVRPLVFALLFVALFFSPVLWAKATGHWHNQVPFEQYRQLDRVMSRATSMPRR